MTVPHLRIYDQIYEKVWGDFLSGDERETIGFHIRNLRKKLFDTDKETTYQIESIWDVAFFFYSYMANPAIAAVKIIMLWDIMRYWGTVYHSDT